jgi:hypothetical protein
MLAMIRMKATATRICMKSTEPIRRGKEKNIIALRRAPHRAPALRQTPAIGCGHRA